MLNKVQINILYEDNHIIVVEKPCNIPTQEDDSKDPDLLTLIKADLKQRHNKPGNVFLGLVHRLDRPVGGVMVFAKTSKAASRLSDQIRIKEFKKTYLAIVHGILPENSGQLVHYLLKNRENNMVKAVPQGAPGSKEAILDYSQISNKHDLTYVEVQLHTGRSHQIRVQFSTIGHPLYGDHRYGKCVGHEQIALWSNEISFKHPTKEETLSFKLNPPDTYPWNLFNV